MLLTTATTAAVDDADDDDDDCCRRRHLLWTYAQQHSDTGMCSLLILINDSKRQRPGRGQLDCAHLWAHAC